MRARHGRKRGRAGTERATAERRKGRNYDGRMEGKARGGDARIISDSGREERRSEDSRKCKEGRRKDKQTWKTRRKHRDGTNNGGEETGKEIRSEGGKDAAEESKGSASRKKGGKDEGK